MTVLWLFGGRKTIVVSVERDEIILNLRDVVKFKFYDFPTNQKFSLLFSQLNHNKLDFRSKMIENTRVELA